MKKIFEKKKKNKKIKKKKEGKKGINMYNQAKFKLEKKN